MKVVRSAVLIALMMVTVLAAPASAATGKPSGPGKGNPYPPGQDGKCDTSEEHGGCPPGSKGKGQVQAFSNTAQAGGPYEAEGTGFQPNSNVEATVSDVVFDSIGTDGSGAFKAVLTIPDRTKAGAHTIKFKGTGADGQLVETQLPLVITGPGLVSAAGSSASVTVVAALIALLVVAGLATLVVRIRSRRVAAEGV